MGESALRQRLESLQAAAESLRNSANNNKITNFAKDLINRAKSVDVSPYVEMFKVPEEYNNMASELQDLTMSGVKTLWARPELSGVRGPVNTVHQEAAWAYKYWDVEKNVQQNVHDILMLLVEIIEAEIKEMQAAMPGFENPITVYTDTEIQADLHLPNRTTLDNAIQTVSGMFQDDEAEIIKYMKKYKPSKKMLRKANKLSKKGKKYNKKM